MMNQGIGSVLDTINQALLQHVTQQQVAPVMQQISQLLSPFTQGQTMGGSGYGPGMQGSSPLDMSSAVQDAIQNRQSPYSPQSNNITSSRDSFGMPVLNRSTPPNLSLTDMSSAGLNTPSYLAINQGNGMDQFNRPVTSKLSEHPAFSGGTPTVPSRQFLGLGSFMGNFQ